MKPIYYIGIGLLLTLFLIAIVSNCGDKKISKVITTSDMQTALLKQKDSLKTVYFKLENDKIDSVKAVEAIKTKQAEYKAQKHAVSALKYLANANKLQNELDSLKTINAPCETQLDKCEDTNQSLRKVIAENDTTIENLGQEAEGYSKRLYLCEKQNFNSSVLILDKDKSILSLNQINESLTDNLKRKNNWFNRNKLWIGFGLGAATTAFILKR